MGREVVLSFIEKLDIQNQVRVRNSIRLLEKHGLDLMQNQSVKKVSNSPDLYELRVVGKVQIRLLFFLYDPGKFVVVHVFLKKTNKTPSKEIQLALKRTKEFI